LYGGTGGEASQNFEYNVDKTENAERVSAFSVIS
jgi:hypothetical protein